MAIVRRIIWFMANFLLGSCECNGKEKSSENKKVKDELMKKKLY